MWTLPLLIVGTAVLLAVPLGLYMAWIFDGRYRPPAWLRWVESRADTGPQTWKQYAFALLMFNVAILVIGFTILSLQDVLPLNQGGIPAQSPDLAFNTSVSFETGPLGHGLASLFWPGDLGGHFGSALKQLGQLCTSTRITDRQASTHGSSNVERGTKRHESPTTGGLGARCSQS